MKNQNCQLGFKWRYMIAKTLSFKMIPLMWPLLLQGTCYSLVYYCVSLWKNNTLVPPQIHHTFACMSCYCATFRLHFNHARRGRALAAISGKVPSVSGVWLLYLSDLAQLFSAICTHYCYCVVHRTITYMRAWFKVTWERQLTLNEIAWQA